MDSVTSRRAEGALEALLVPQMLAPLERSLGPFGEVAAGTFADSFARALEQQHG